MDSAKTLHLKGIDRREDFTHLIDQREYRVGVEIGVDCGAFSASLLFNSTLRILYGVDTWEKYPERKIAAENSLKPFRDRSKLLTAASPTVAEKFPNEFFDFIYIDGDHRYRPVKADINGFWPKLKPGGCLAGHDYVERRMCGVIRAVDEFIQQNNLGLYTTKEDGPLPTDQLISWFVFKPETRNP